LEIDNPDYSIFGDSPFAFNGNVPTDTLQFAISAVIRQTPDGRLSQNVGDALDGAALDGASAGSVVLLGSLTDPSRKQYWEDAAAAQLNYVVNIAPRTATGAISHRAQERQYWADGVYMGPPFLAYYGAVTHNHSLLVSAYTNCKLYRDALRYKGPTGYLWRHIFDDDNQTWVDQGIWASGNAWAALGMLRVSATISRSSHAHALAYAVEDLNLWTKEILDNTFAALGSDNLVPNYIYGQVSFGGDGSASAALASVAYRAATLFPDTFGCNYTKAAAKVRDAIIDGINDLGLLSPVVSPLNWSSQGILSTEAQAFGLMMFAAWRDYLQQM